MKQLPQALFDELNRLKSLSPDIKSDLLTLQGPISLSSEALLNKPLKSSIYKAKVISRNTIADLDGKTVLEIKFELDRKVNMDSLDVGQSIAVSAHNRLEDVNKVLDTFGWDSR